MTSESESNWQALEARVDELIKRYIETTRENRALRVQQRNLSAERAALIDKTERAKTQVEAAISRLKELEQD